jgi:type IV secretory pathway TraG/TraD family ATPase VirD4
MPKFPMSFTRRKSSGNALDEINDSSVSGTFKVFDRNGDGTKTLDGPLNVARTRPSSAPRINDANIFEEVKGSRYVSNSARNLRLISLVIAVSQTQTSRQGSVPRPQHPPRPKSLRMSLDTQTSRTRNIPCHPFPRALPPFHSKPAAEPFLSAGSGAPRPRVPSC